MLDRETNLRMAALSLIVIAFSGCSSGPPKPKYPAFVSYTDRQKARVDAGNSQFGNITERLAAIGQEVYAKTEFQQVDTVLNDGPPSQGAKILITGSALSDGLVKLEWGRVVALNDDESEGQHMDLNFTAESNGSYTATPEISYKGKFNVITDYRASKKSGEGDIKVFVSPTDSHAISSANFTHNYKVLSQYASEDDPD